MVQDDVLPDSFSTIIHQQWYRKFILPVPVFYHNGTGTGQRLLFPKKWRDFFSNGGKFSLIFQLSKIPPIYFPPDFQKF